MAGACPAEFIELAERLAAASGAVIRELFRTPFTVDRKSDATPVTIADREAERTMRELIAEAYPDHGILGEEHGNDRVDAEHVWVLDPIDGTRSFIAGKPIFGTLISLTRNGAPIMGVIDQPINGERWIGAVGLQTTFNGAPVATRPCPALDQAILNTTSPDLFEGDDQTRFRKIASASREVLYGGDCYAYGLVASGFVDLVVEMDLKPYDYCALAPVVIGAGGAMTDWRGALLKLGSDGRVVASGDPTLHAQVIKALDFVE
jgi:inositol-phosphate phosphatase / L-galactose 1-phosphate phosphatase / histidinol-phosphatase